MKTEEFCHIGEAIKKEPYHYRSCGLEGIYLLNGYERGVHDGENTVRIKNIDDLHKVIGQHLVLTRKVLSPREIRFLRNTMDWTQAEMATKLGKDSQTIARWEKGSEMPSTADKLLRLYFMLYLMPDDESPNIKRTILSKLETLYENDEERNPQAQFELSDRWNEAPVPLMAHA